MTKLWTAAAPAFRESGDWPRQDLRTRQDRRSRPARRNLERAMAVAVVPREDNAFANDNPPPARNAVLARYRQLREISKRHHHDILKLLAMLSSGVFEQWAYGIVRSRHGRHGKMDMRRGSSVRFGGIVSTTSLCSANAISAICSIRIKNTYNEFERARCRMTRRPR